MSTLNSDPEVMEFFPSTKSLDETNQFIKRMQDLFEKKGYCYFAVDKLNDGQFIGFIGFGWQTWEADFNPSVDIGWRLAKAHWGKGFATEGAKRCLQFAFKNLGLKKVYSIASVININSTNVMQKIGMKQITYFEHPILLDFPLLKKCVLYSLETKISSLIEF